MSLPSADNLAVANDPPTSLLANASVTSERRARGAFYTPADLANYVAAEALPTLRGAPRIVDPACGDGRLLVATLQRLFQLANATNADPQIRLRLLRQSLFGVDRCPEACLQAKRHLLAEALGARIDSLLVTSNLSELSRNVITADALLDEPNFPRQTFDVVVANPPFVNVRRLSKSYSAAEIEQLRDRYQTATGNFDLYALFIERALGWLADRGRAVFITPNKLATLNYARACRRLLLEQTTIETVLDGSSAKWFVDADVYPYVWTLRKEQAERNHMTEVRRIRGRERTDPECSTIPQKVFDEQGFVLEDDLRVEDRVAVRRLGECGTLHSGASGYTAQRWLEHLVEADGDDRTGWEFIVSGNIDRYRIALGSVRYLKRRFTRPKLLESCPLTPAKQTLYSEPKIVISGMGRRLETAFDSRGLALGVQVYALAQCRLDPDYLVGLLNSKLLSHLFRTRFAAKRLSGGYLAVNKSQLELLPIVEPQGADRELAERITRAVRRRRKCPPDQGSRGDWLIDQLTYRLYRLTAEEAAEVERSVV